MLIFGTLGFFLFITDCLLKVLKTALNSDFHDFSGLSWHECSNRLNANKTVFKPEQVRIEEISMFIGCSIVCGKLMKFALDFKLIA